MKTLKIVSKFLLVKVPILLIFNSGLISCTDDDSDYLYEEARGLVVNASPNSGDLYFYSDDNQINTDGAGYNHIYGYYRFSTGDRSMSVRDQQNVLLDSKTVHLNRNEYFSVFAVNTFDHLELMVYKDLLEYPGVGNSSIRMINLTSDSQPVNLYLNSTLIAENLAFKQAGSFIRIAEGYYDLKITDSADGEILYQESDVPFYSNRIYTIYSKGYKNPPAGSNDSLSINRIRNY
ncbi:MAG: DUF4397 domain-containing protein [Moheibacter sp.]